MNLEKAVEAHLRNHQAKEIIRTRQQGYGRPIVSCEMNDYRIVCVGNRLAYGKGWVFFTDFLFRYLGDTLGKEWLKEANRAGLAHPLLAWQARFETEMRKRAAGTSNSALVPQTGYVKAMFQLAYSLYLLEHHDQLPPTLIKRLRFPDHFRPAVYETIAASAFALAGYEIRMAEIKATRESQPEFYATAKSGKIYAVEAKRRNSWRALCDVADNEFARELKSWVRNRIFDASRKRLRNPIFWLELSIAAPFDEAAWRVVHAWIRESIDDLESRLGTRADAPEPAYVFVTNHPELGEDDAPTCPLFAVLEPFRMDDLRTGRFVELEAGFEARDRHRDVTWVFECLSEVLRIPMTFDGSIPELRGPDGSQTKSLRIGSEICVPGPDGSPFTGTLYDITTMGDHAYVGVSGINGTHVIATVPLTASEKDAVSTYGDAVFGKPLKKQASLKSAFELYTISLKCLPPSTSKLCYCNSRRTLRAQRSRCCVWPICGSGLPASLQRPHIYQGWVNARQRMRRRQTNTERNDRAAEKT